MFAPGRWILVLLVLLGTATAATAQGKYEWKDGKWVKSAPPRAGTEKGDLSLVRDLVERKQGKKAVKAADKFLAAYPNSKAREEVMCLAGQAELDRGRLFQAYEWFEMQVAAFPNGRYFDRALERNREIAERFLKGEKRIVMKVLRMPAQDDGLEILSRIAEHVPGTEMARKALIRIGDYYFNKAEYSDAAEAYDHFLSLYGKSRQAPYAMLQAARSAFRTFRGVQYDATSLLDAQQRYRTFTGRFPLYAKKVGVDVKLKRIESLLAEKLYEDAKFYERVHRKRAAVFYYQRIRRLYPKTTYAARAREALRAHGVLRPQTPADLTNTIKRPAFRPLSPRGKNRTEK